MNSRITRLAHIYFISLNKKINQSRSELSHKAFIKSLYGFNHRSYKTNPISDDKNPLIDKVFSISPL